MKTIAKSQATTKAPPSAVFARWADMETWPEWNHDTEWVRLDGRFVTGATGVLKPRGGPKVKFRIERLVPETEFVDVSLLPGARLKFEHRVTPSPEGGCTIEVTISISGPLRHLWTRILGGGFRQNAQPDLDRLVEVAERRAIDHASAAL